MKNNKMLFVVLSGVLLLVIGFFLGCGSLNTVSSGGSTSSRLFYTSTSGTTPVFEPSSALSWGVQASDTTTLESITGTPLYSVYFTLREFLASRDEGIVDRSNLYKLLIDVDTVYSGFSSSPETITEQSITSPFAQLPSVVCDSAFNNEIAQTAGARKETSAEVNAIITWIWTDEGNDDKAEYGIATLSYDKLTKDITVEMTYSVDYDTSTSTSEYNLRCFVTGNPEENAFRFKYIIGDQKIVAQGVSSGEGNYMLFKYSSGEATNYIVVPAEAGEDFFIGQNSSPTQIFSNPDNLPSSVEAYKDWVVDTAFFASDNLLTDISILNSGNSKEGTIYLDYD